MHSLAPIAAIGIYNNTGLNPHYAAINRIRPEFFTSGSLECCQAGEVHGTDHDPLPAAMRRSDWSGEPAL